MSVNGFTFDDGVTFQKYNYESLDNKPDLEEGTFPNVAVGQLVGDTGITDTEPYFLRPSASIGDREFDTLVGGTLGWNQLLQNGNFESDTGWGARHGTVSVADNVITVAATQVGTLCGLTGGSFTIQTNHVYLMGIGVYSPINGTVSISFGGESALSVNHDVTANAWAQCGVIVKSNKNEGKSFYTLINESINTGDIIKYRTAQVIDLTIDFGATIADYIYSLETAHAGDGVAWVRKYLPETYYAYCAPTLKHVSGVSAHVMRDANNNVIGNYAIDSTWVGMGIPKLDSANKLYFDGDRYASDGTVTERYGIVDLGTLDWGYSDTRQAFNDTVPNMAHGSILLICGKYPFGEVVSSASTVASKSDKAMYTQTGNAQLFIKDSAFTDAATFKTAMSGVYLVYEKATPTTSTASPFTSPQICDKDGTEEYVTSGLVPVGHETFYPENPVYKLNAIPSLPTTAGSYRLKVTVSGGVPSYEWTMS